MYKKLNQAFTVIEVIVWVTILSIIMISVMSIYISTSDINLKTNINRSMQENIKNAVETMAEDIRKNGADGVKNDLSDTDCTVANSGKHISGSNLCIFGNVKYSLWKLNPTTGVYTVTSNNECDEVSESGCTILKNGKPLMNSWVDVKHLEFKVSSTEISKVTILMEVQPSVKKWVRPDLIKQNRMDFQTTISQRPDLN